MQAPLPHTNSPVDTPAPSGTRFRYSPASALLGLVVEAASGGRPLAEFFRTEIFTPLGMSAATGFHVPANLLHRLATRYLGTSTRGVAGTGGLAVLHEVDPGRSGTEHLTPAMKHEAAQRAGGKAIHNAVQGDGGLFSTPADWHKLCAALLNDGRPLFRRAEAFRALLVPSTPELTAATEFMTHFTDVAEGGAVSGPGSGGPQLFFNLRFGGMAHNLIGEAAVSSCNALGASQGTYGWEGIFTTKYGVDPAERLVYTFWSAVMPCWRFNVKGKCVPMLYRALRTPAVPHPAAFDSPTAALRWRGGELPSQHRLVVSRL